MTVRNFNRQKGLYRFQLNDVETEFHSHPALEIIMAEVGTFTISTPSSEHKDVSFAVVAPNVQHRVTAIGCTLDMIMVEHHTSLVKDILLVDRIKLTHEIYFQDKRIDLNKFYQNISRQILQQGSLMDYDERVQKVIRYIDDYEPDYRVMITALRSIAHLSESRLSHLFKDNVGISLKKYLVWSKLKSTIAQHLDKKEDLLTSLLESGFYDQPHFIRSFKSMLGINPARVYNSRILQG